MRGPSFRSRNVSRRRSGIKSTRRCSTVEKWASKKTISTHSDFDWFTETCTLPFMTWTAGQREFTPLLMGLYHLLPRTNLRKREGTNSVVIEEPEMGLHPQAITAVLLLVLDLIWRGYRVVLSTHSPHVLALMWLMKILKENDARWQLLCQAFDVKTAPMRAVAEAALTKDYRAFLLQFGSNGKVDSAHISDLHPSSDDRGASRGGAASPVPRLSLLTPRAER